MRFADTSLLLYAISRDPGERRQAAVANEVLTAGDLAVSVQVLQEFYVQATRASGFGISYWDGGIRVENPFR